jgi:hypothetical protein
VRRTLFFVAAAAALALTISAPALAASKPRPALAQAPRDGLTRALEQRQITPAKYALDRALSLFRPGQMSARYEGIVERPDPHAATILLRDLALRLENLSAADRARARALLARPTDNPNPDDFSNTYGATAEATPLCGDFVCIHYVASTSNASTNEYATQALAVFDDVVWPTEVTSMGYRAPKTDITSENTGASSANVSGSKFDVYLTDLGDDELYGYCTSDDPNVTDPPPYDFSAYCVVDNDYVGFPGTATDNLTVTAAHEFFHAVQAAYDWYEDQWFMESTATWIEDQVYDAVNDNVQYLSDGPLGRPTVPLDKGATQADPCCHVYGDWIYFRFLSEWLGDPSLSPATVAEDPTIVREIWERADGSLFGPDNHSIQAVRNELTARGKNFRKVFGKFGWANRIAQSVYDEGFANTYPQAPLSAAAMTLSSASPSRSKSVTVNHLTSRYYKFTRGAGAGSSARLRFVLDLPATKTGTFASALVFDSGGGVTPYEFSISSVGDGTFNVPFGSNVTRVDLVLTNGSTRYSCWRGTVYACMGRPTDDGRTYRFTARLR